MFKANLAKKSNDFEDADKALAYMVWLAEKEFHIMVDRKFPILKLFNWFDDYNIERYNHKPTSTKEETPTW